MLLISTASTKTIAIFQSKKLCRNYVNTLHISLFRFILNFIHSDLPTFGFAVSR